MTPPVLRTARLVLRPLTPADADALFPIFADAETMRFMPSPPHRDARETRAQLAADMGRFRAPTLRNVALTAPYMHDGSVATLDEALDHYAHGGRLIAEGEDAGDGSLSPLKSQLVPGFTLTEEQRADLLAFLMALTDEGFVTDPRFSDPFGEE